MHGLAGGRVGKVDAGDGIDEHENQERKNKVHRRARAQHHRTLPKGLAAILLLLLGLEERGGVVEPARGARSYVLGCRRSIDVVLVAAERALDGPPLGQLLKRDPRLLLADVEEAGDIVHGNFALVVDDVHDVAAQGLGALGLAHARDARVAPKGDGGDAELGALVREADMRARQAEHELGAAHAEHARGKEVPALVNEHEHGQKDNKDDDGDKGVHESRLTKLRAGGLARTVSEGAAFNHIGGGFSGPGVHLKQLLYALDGLNAVRFVQLHHLLNGLGDA